MHERPTVVLSGGGTGGHLYPALAIADALRRRRPGARLVFVGAERGLEARVLPERGEEHVLLPVEGLARGRVFSNWRALPALLVSLWRARALLGSLRPDVVVVTGGYAGGPSGIVAALGGTPLVLQEQNAVPGLTTRVLSRWARHVFVAFPETVESFPARVRSRVVHAGNPVRTPPGTGRGAARTQFGLPADASVLLVVGGSQGAAALNRLVLDAVVDVAAGALPRPDSLHVLWATGPRHHRQVVQRLDAAGSPGWVHAVAYIDDVPAALAATDLAVSRAGAIATAELLNQSVPAILVPLPTAAAGHQAHNAEALAAAGAALVRTEADLTHRELWTTALDLLDDAPRLRAMADAAGASARPGAADQIAASIDALMSSPEVDR